MDPSTPNYRGEFLTSPHHAAWGLLTLGVGFLSAHVLGLIAGLTIYVLGWIYLPDMGFFRRWTDRRFNASRQAAETLKLAEFLQKREALLRSLAPKRRERYTRLVQVCRDIEVATGDNSLSPGDPSADPRLRKLDELMWTFLRLLGIEESLERFLETERREDLPGLVKAAEDEAARLNADIEALKTKGNTTAVESKQRYLGSRLERLEVLRKREQRLQQADENAALVVSEQERLDQQIKLLRADAMASKNAETLTARIDATVQHLDQTNKWISEMDEFKDLVADLPPTDQRVGYEALAGAPMPPVIQPTGNPIRTQPPLRQRQSS